MRSLNIASRTLLAGVVALTVAASAVADSAGPPPSLAAGSAAVRLERIEGTTSYSSYIADPSWQLCTLKGVDAVGDNGSFWSNIYQDGSGNWYISVSYSRKGGQVYWTCVR